MVNAYMIVSAALNLLLAGLGHLFLGFWKRSLLWLGGLLILAVLVSYVFPNITPAQTSAGLLVIGILAAIDILRLIKKRGFPETKAPRIFIAAAAFVLIAGLVYLVITKIII